MDGSLPDVFLLKEDKLAQTIDMFDISREIIWNYRVSTASTDSRQAVFAERGGRNVGKEFAGVKTAVKAVVKATVKIAVKWQ